MLFQSIRPPNPIQIHVGNVLGEHLERDPQGQERLAAHKRRREDPTYSQPVQAEGDGAGTVGMDTSQAADRVTKRTDTYLEAGSPTARARVEPRRGAKIQAEDTWDFDAQMRFLNELPSEANVPMGADQPAPTSSSSSSGLPSAVSPAPVPIAETSSANPSGRCNHRCSHGWYEY